MKSNRLASLIENMEGVVSPGKPDQHLIDVELQNIKGLFWQKFGDLKLELLPVEKLFISEEGTKNPVYSDLLSAGTILPPVFVVYDDEIDAYEIWDGNKRYVSHVAAGFTHIWSLVQR